MSSIRDPAYITDTGQTMMTAGGDITYTKAVLYGQDISNLRTDQIKALTTIGNPLRETQMGVSGKKDTDGHTTVILEATFQNNNLKADLPYTAVGFFARKDDKEKLVAVAVANKGTYLAATSPDGVATDALDLKLAITIGDTANVTTMIDPAGSVTPATLNGTIDKVTQSLTAKIDTKADSEATQKALDKKANKADVEASLATKANSTDLDKTNAEVAKKANSDDVKAQIDGVSKSISDVSDTVKANKDATDQALATKADKTDVAKDIDTVNKSISSMSATITANQKATDTALDTKADKTTVNQELATKANSADVDDKLAAKADSADVDKKLDKKADKSSIDAKINAIDFSKIKFRKQRVNSDGQAADTTWSATKNSDGSYTIDIYQDDWTAYKVASLLQAITTKADQSSLDATNKTVATKANSSDVYTKKQVDDAFSSRDATIATKANASDVADSLATKANKTDLEALAKTADVNSALDTKADKATVNSDIKTINDTMATKADKTTVDGDVKTLQASIDTKADKTALDDYAKSADVASDVKTLTDSIATKADAKTVNDAISKIDFTPYAKSADVDSKLKDYTDTADLTKLLAGKADSDFSYSKAELDKKLLDLTTTTGGKVDASQVATMIENKADKSDVTKQIGTVTDLVNTKANSTDVTAALDKKDDTTDVDAKIKKVTDLANKAQSTADSKVKSNWAIDNSNGKFVAANVPAVGTATQSFTQTGLDLLNTLATKSQVADAKNTANQAIDDYNKRPVIRGNDGDDLLAYKTNQLRLYVDCKNCKNLPPASNTQWFTVEYIFENPNGDGVAIFRSPASEVWLNGNNGGNYNNWLRLANAGDITNLQNAINAKANSSDVYSKSDVDYRTHGTIITDYDIASLTPTREENNYINRWLVDQNVLHKFAEQINQLKGRQNVDAPDFNNLTDTGVYYVSDSKYKGMTNGPTNNWGVLVVSNGSNNRISQVYYPDSDVPPWMRVKSDTWHNWIQLGTNGDIQTAANLANAASNKVDTVLANSYFRKQGMDANGNCVEIRGNAIKQSNGGYAFDIWPNDWTASKLKDVIKNQLPSKADKSQVNTSNNLFNRMTDDSTWKTITGIDNTNNPVLTSLRDDSPIDGGNTIGGNGAGVAFGGGDTKGVLSVCWQTPHAVITGGNGTAPVWHEEIAWKSDINSTNQTVSALQQTIKTLNDTLSSANATIKTLQDTITKQATTITGLQTQVSNQANEIKQLQETTIKGKTFSKSQEAAAEAWEQQNSQQIAFIRDKQ